jgi:lipid II:glycine glycyltransferase (peptidoglycan interpeptide bridge formation enzyme)
LELDLQSGWRISGVHEQGFLDELVANNPASGFMQSGFWTDFKRTEGYEVLRLVYDLEGRPVGCASLLRFPAGNAPNFVLCPEGPVLPWDQILVARTALRQLVTCARELPNTIGLRIEPHLPVPLPSILRNWSDSPTDLTPPDTIILDLGISEDTLLAKARPKCRYNLKIADREGIEVEHCQDMGVARDFHQLLMETAHRAGFFCEPFGFFLNLFSVLFTQNQGELLIARSEGQMLAAILVVYFGKRATYLYGASSSMGRNKMPTYPLHREAMRRGRARGCTEYDLYGIDAFERRDHLYAGITRFKRQWGGTVHRRIGARDALFYDRLAELIVQRVGDEVPNWLTRF